MKDHAERPTVTTALRSITKAVRREVLFVFGFSFFLNLLVLATPIYMMQVFDRVLSSGRIETLIYLTVLAAGAIALYGALDLLRGRILARVASWLDGTLSPEVIDASVTASLQGQNIGAQGLREVATVRGFLASPGVHALLDSPWTPAFVAVIFLIHPQLGITAVAGALILLTLAVLNDRITYRHLADAGRGQLKNLRAAEAIVDNADAVRAMGLGPGLLSRWGSRHGAVMRDLTSATERGGAVLATSKSARMFVQVAILGLGAFFVIRNELTPGGMIAASILLGRSLAPVEQAISGWRGFRAARTSYGRLKQLLSQTAAKGPSVTLPRPQGRLALEQVSYAPAPGARPLVRDVSFILEPGTFCGLVGPSAAGKSTLCRLMVGSLRPSSGHVRIDGAALSAWHPAELGPHIGYVPQDVELFAGTAAENIARLRDAPSERIIEAANRAGLHEAILQLPAGYDTDIGDYGTKLSAGQRQRLALARALFGDPALLVLDEPYANLDPVGEAALMSSLADARRRGATIVMVAHRPDVLQDCTAIAYLNAGTLQAFGPRDVILPKLLGKRPSADQRVVTWPAARASSDMPQPVEAR